MSQGLTMDASVTVSNVPNQNMLAFVEKQRMQDFFFHKITLTFSLLVLFALMGIIVSLIINAWPAF